jgi:hypothetical protein
MMISRDENIHSGLEKLAAKTGHAKTAREVFEKLAPTPRLPPVPVVTPTGVKMKQVPTRQPTPTPPEGRKRGRDYSGPKGTVPGDARNLVPGLEPDNQSPAARKMLKGTNPPTAVYKVDSTDRGTMSRVPHRPAKKSPVNPRTGKPYSDRFGTSQQPEE